MLLNLLYIWVLFAIELPSYRGLLQRQLRPPNQSVQLLNNYVNNSTYLNNFYDSMELITFLISLAVAGQRLTCGQVSVVVSKLYFITLLLFGWSDHSICLRMISNSSSLFKTSIIFR
jgi:hypothetical protein